MKRTGANRVHKVITAPVAGKTRHEPPATEEEARLRATGKSIYRLAKDIGRAYWWVNALVTGRLQVVDSQVRLDIRKQIEAYEKEAEIQIGEWKVS